MAIAATSSVRFSPDILRRLGEELNPTPDQGIIELVKNAYDADAIECTIELIATEQPGGTVKITDSGDGMASREIDAGWLVLGRSSKTKGATTALGRTPAGSKGLGRLAALRLGAVAQVSTRPVLEPGVQYSAELDWSRYDAVDVVEDVPIEIETSTVPSEKWRKGTDVVVSSLRTSIGRMDIKRLARALILLADPFGDSPGGFRPKLIAKEFDDLATLVSKKYFDDADFHLQASVGPNGMASARVTDSFAKELFSAAHDDLVGKDRKGRTYDCPPTRFDLWVFILDSDSFSTHKVTLGEVKDWLDAFGGIHLYENGLRVSPYGNPGNDWLDLNLSRARSPEERPSTNTAIGRVSVVDNLNRLAQKTDRSGFVEDTAFRELRAFAHDSLEWMHRRRLEVAEVRRARERKEGPRKSRQSRKRLQDVLRQLPRPYRKPVEAAVASYEASRDRDVRQLKKEVQLYRTLSTAGITAATFAHEATGNPLKVITHSISAIRRRGTEALGKVAYSSKLGEPVAAIEGAIASLGVLSAATLRLLEHSKRRFGRVEVHAVIENLIATFTPFVEAQDVKILLKLAPGRPFLRGSEASIESIFTNLLNNSLVAFEHSSERHRKLEVQSRVERDVLEVRVADNGPGIEGIAPADIWLPGQSTRENGTGLGLTIVRDAVTDMGGEVEAEAHGHLGGAELIIRLPILGV